MTHSEEIEAANPGWRTEQCTCVHFRVVHANRGMALGHGACMVEGCPCALFTWTRPSDLTSRQQRRIENFRRRQAT